MPDTPTHGRRRSNTSSSLQILQAVPVSRADLLHKWTLGPSLRATLQRLRRRKYPLRGKRVTRACRGLSFLAINPGRLSGGTVERSLCAVSRSCSQNAATALVEHDADLVREWPQYLAAPAQSRSRTVTAAHLAQPPPLRRRHLRPPAGSSTTVVRMSSFGER